MNHHAEYSDGYYFRRGTKLSLKPSYSDPVLQSSKVSLSGCITASQNKAQKYLHEDQVYSNQWSKIHNACKPIKITEHAGKYDPWWREKSINRNRCGN